MSEQYWNFDGKDFSSWTEKPIRGRDYFYDYTWYGIRTYVQIVPGYRNHSLESKEAGF